MEVKKEQIIHDFNNLSVKLKSIFHLLLDESNEIELNQMLADGDQAIQDLQELWKKIKSCSR